MNINELTAHAEKFLMDNYNLELTIPIELCGRISRTMGYFAHSKGKPLRIVLSKKLLKYGSKHAILDTLNHELIHYALFMLKRPYTDASREFKNECKRLNVGLTEEISVGMYYEYKCDKCGRVAYTESKTKAENKNNRYHTRCCESSYHVIGYVIDDGEKETKYAYGQGVLL